MEQPNAPPAISIVGRKNSGKTTLLVALATELGRRGLRVGSIKHGHPHFEIDRPGSDSYRHLHEGGVGGVLLASSARLAFIEGVDGEVDPRALLSRFFAGCGYDIVLVEGYKRGPFPKIEIYRGSGHEHPLYDPGEAEVAASYLAIATDDPGLSVNCPVIQLEPDGSHVPVLADTIEVVAVSAPAAEVHSPAAVGDAPAARSAAGGKTDPAERRHP